MDATELLKRDHDTVAKLFQRFRMGRANRARRSVLEQICAELTVHAQIEEEIFYPAVRETGDGELVEKVGEATREHAEIKAGVDALRARADLFKRLEDFFLVFRPNADAGVLNFKAQGYAFCIRRRRH